MVKLESNEILNIGGAIIFFALLPALIIFLAGLPIWIILGALALIYTIFFKKGRR